MSELHVGREMDAAVAEAVGLVCREIHAPEWGFNVPTPCWVVKDTTKPFGWGCVRVENWHPSTSIADAFAALDAMLAKHPDWECSVLYRSCVQAPGQYKRMWTVTIGKWERSLSAAATLGHALADTPAEAICRAILALEAT